MSTPAGGTVPGTTPPSEPAPGTTPPGAPGATPPATPSVEAAVQAAVAAERARHETELAAVRSQLEELQRRNPAPPKDAGAEDAAFRAKVEEARKPLEDQLAALTKRLTDLDDAAIASAIEREADALSVAPKDVAEALRPLVKRGADGKSFEVVDKDGRPVYGASGVKTVGELVREHLAAKPYLAKPNVRQGIHLGNVPKGQADPTALDARIAEAEAAGNFAEAGRLKAEKLRARMK